MYCATCGRTTPALDDLDIPLLGITFCSDLCRDEWWEQQREAEKEARDREGG